jgi:uncharacterized membrane protein
MTRIQQPALTFFAIGLIGLGILALIYGDFALVWQPVSPWVPGRTALAYASGVLMLLCGVTLFFQPAAKYSIRVLLPYLKIWVLLKVPALIVAPQVEGVWLGIGELTMLLAGGWTLFAMLADLPERWRFRLTAGESAVRGAQILFAISLIPVGLSHLMYVKETAAYVPAWLPYPVGWAYLTGIGQMACGIGLLFRIFPRAAAVSEAAMLTIFTLLVWVPAIIAEPHARLPWTAFFISWIIAAGAWVVAGNIVSNPTVKSTS